MFATWSISLRHIVILFIAGFAAGTLLRMVGALPSLHPYNSSWSRSVSPASGQTGQPSLRGSDDVAALQPSSIQTVAPAQTRSVPLLGDGDPSRDALRRAVVVHARQALVAPCEVDSRIAYQNTLHEYARAFAASPGLYRTTLDSEAGRAIALTFQAGLIDPALVERWRGSERSGLAALLAPHGLALSVAAPSGCRSG